MPPLFNPLSMNLYKDHCYETLDLVSDQIQSNFDLGAGWVVINSTVISRSKIQVDVQKANNNKSYILIPPSCTDLGFQSSYSGLTMQDSIELNGLVLLMFAVAFVGKMLRRGAR